MTIAVTTAIRTAIVQLIITAAGASAKWKLYNGTRPASGAAVTSQVLLALLTAGATIGTAAAGVIDLDEAGITQINTNHVSGTPTWFRLTTSADVWVADFSITADGVFSGVVTNGVDVTMGAPSTITAPGA